MTNQVIAALVLLVATAASSMAMPQVNLLIAFDQSKSLKQGDAVCQVQSGQPCVKVLADVAEELAKRVRDATKNGQMRLGVFMFCDDAGASESSQLLATKAEIDQAIGEFKAIEAVTDTSCPANGLLMVKNQILNAGEDARNAVIFLSDNNFDNLEQKLAERMGEQIRALDARMFGVSAGFAKFQEVKMTKIVGDGDLVFNSRDEDASQRLQDSVMEFFRITDSPTKAPTIAPTSRPTKRRRRPGPAPVPSPVETEGCEETVLPNQDYFKFDLDPPKMKNVENWETCQALCKENEDCYFWSYVAKDYKRKKMRLNCYLKDSSHINHARLRKIKGITTGRVCKENDTDTL